MPDGKNQSDEPEQSAQPSSPFRDDVTRYVKATAKKFLPSGALEEAVRYRTFSGRERALYLKIRALNAVGMLNHKRSLPPKSVHSFLFVCFGNIMRSPMCESLMNRAVPDVGCRHITVNSAGLNAVPGRAAHPWAIAAARELGVSLESHRARLLTAEMVNQADAIFAMDFQNQVQLWSRYPDARNKVFMLSAYAGKGHGGSVEISDPYYLGEAGTRACYEMISICIHNLVSSLCGERRHPGA